MVTNMHNFQAGSVWTNTNTQQRLVDDQAFRDAAFKVVTGALNVMANKDDLGALVYNKARNNSQYIENILIFVTFFAEMGLSMQPGIDRGQLLNMCVRDVLDIHAIQELKDPSQHHLQYRISGDTYKYYANRGPKLQQKLDAVVQRNGLRMTINLSLQGAAPANQYSGVAMNTGGAHQDTMWGSTPSAPADNSWWGNETTQASQRTKSVSELYFDNVALGAGMDSPHKQELNVKPSVIDSLFQDSTQIIEKRGGKTRQAAATIGQPASDNDFDWQQPSSHMNHGVLDEFNSDRIIQDMEAQPYHAPVEESDDNLWSWVNGMEEDDSEAFDYGADKQPVPDHIVQAANKLASQATQPVQSAAKPAVTTNAQGDRHVGDGWHIANPDTWNEVFAAAPRNSKQPFNLSLPLKGTRLYRRNQDGTLEQRLLDIPMERFNHNPADLLAAAHTAEEFDEELNLTQAIRLTDAMVVSEGDKPKRVNSEYLKETASTDRIQALVDDKTITGFSESELTVRAVARSHKAAKEIKAQGTAGVNVEYTLEKAELLHIANDAEDFLHKVSFLTQGDTEEFKTYLDFYLRFVELRDAIHHDVYHKLDKHLLRVINDFLTFDLGYEGKLALEHSFVDEFAELCEYLNRKDPDALRAFKECKDDLLKASRVIANSKETDRLRKIFLSRIGKAEYDAAVEIMEGAVFTTEHQLNVRSGLKAEAFGLDTLAAPGNHIIMKQSAYPNTLAMLFSAMERTRTRLAQDVHFNVRFITADGYSFGVHDTFLMDDVLVLARRG